MTSVDSSDWSREAEETGKKVATVGYRRNVDGNPSPCRQGRSVALMPVLAYTLMGMVAGYALGMTLGIAYVMGWI